MHTQVAAGTERDKWETKISDYVVSAWISRLWPLKWAPASPTDVSS